MAGDALHIFERGSNVSMRSRMRDGGSGSRAYAIRRSRSGTSGICVLVPREGAMRVGRRRDNGNLSGLSGKVREGRSTMKGMLRLSILFATLALSIGCSHHSDLSRPAAQDNFGVQMARMNLWREAMFRFERAIEINPERRAGAQQSRRRVRGQRRLREGAQGVPRGAEARPHQSLHPEELQPLRGVPVAQQEAAGDRAESAPPRRCHGHADRRERDDGVNSGQPDRPDRRGVRRRPRPRRRRRRRAIVRSLRRRLRRPRRRQTAPGGVL